MRGHAAAGRVGQSGRGQDGAGCDELVWDGGSQPAQAGLASPVVQDMIRITVQPESQVVTEGTRVSLTCWATGPPRLAYQWFRGKREVRSRRATPGRPCPWPGHPGGWVGAPDPSAPSCLTGAGSHVPGAGDRGGRRAGAARVVHLPGKLRGHLRLLQVGPRAGGEEQQPQLRWVARSASRAGTWGHCPPRGHRLACGALAQPQVSWVG